MATLRVEVALVPPTSTAFTFDDATRGRFGTGTFGAGAFGSAGEFVDVSAYVRRGQVTRSSSRFDGITTRPEPGTAEVLLDNRDARFDPTNPAGPYLAAGESQIRPLVAWRIRAVDTLGATHNVWRGFADGWELDYPLNGLDATCLLRGTDATKVLANIERPPLETEVGAGEDTGARIGRILDNAGWPAADRDLDVGLTAVQATDLGRGSWAEILLTADTEVGSVLIDRTGKVVFRNRNALSLDPASADSQATFGDGPGELGYTGLTPAYDDDTLANEVRIGRENSDVEGLAIDAASQSRYLPRSFVRTDLLHTTDAESQDLADYVLAILKDPELRFESIALFPQEDPDAIWPQALGREIGDRITIRRRPPGRADVIEREVLVRGIAHDFDPATWTTTFTLQDASRIGFFVLDDASLGVLDSDRLGL